MLSDMKIGSFFNTNFGGLSGERAYIHRFMVDVLLGVDPAYNATEVCEIFEDRSTIEIENVLINFRDFFSDSEVSLFKDLELLPYFLSVVLEPNTAFSFTQTQAKIIHKAKLKLMEQGNTAGRVMENYEGIYGNFIFGNITVKEDYSCTDCLYLEYGSLGQFVLQPTNTTDYFIGFGAYPSFPILTAFFFGEDESGNVLNALIPLFELTNPPVFERELLMSEAPEPRNELCVPFY